MQITKPGKYQLTERYSTRGSRSIAQLPAGAIIEITQIDRDGHKVIGPQLEDWEYYDIPCVPIDALAKVEDLRKNQGVIL